MQHLAHYILRQLVKLRNTYTLDVFTSAELLQPELAPILDELSRLGAELAKEDAKRDDLRSLESQKAEMVSKLEGEKRGAVVLARHNQSGCYIGFIIVGADTREAAYRHRAMAGQAFVESEHRRRGVFSCMVDRVEEVARELGYKEIMGYPSWDGRAAGILLLKKGYRLDDDDRRGLIIVKKTLVPDHETRAEGRPRRERW